MKKPLNQRLRGFLNEDSSLKAVWTRLELATPCVTGRYSNQLNYQTVALMRGQIYYPF